MDNICVGCGRTVREIRIWSSCSDEEKQRIISESRIRASSLQKLRDQGLSDDQK